MLLMDVLPNVSKIYKQMKLLKIPTDSLTVTDVLSSCSSVGSYDFGSLIHTELEKKRPVQSNVALQSALLTMCSKRGRLVSRFCLHHKCPCAQESKRDTI
jgi:hypothetical protein